MPPARSARSGRTSTEGECMDIVYIGLTLGFFALSWALIKLCERV